MSIPASERVALGREKRVTKAEGFGDDADELGIESVCQNLEMCKLQLCSLYLYAEGNHIVRIITSDRIGSTGEYLIEVHVFGQALSNAGVYARGAESPGEQPPLKVQAV
ncbi:hypothetical protein CERSUDRAFT_97699 [Gelatoporia subvermispora B]|uniref:Uncharacterized protein n=1 Tax=Ceriporiopsis subvermispora (strain B) TaxID=914234 RepID=M2PEY7_CERS8|nr:hypothetical protein CERSUDRAFT_97699 [Gelatoporia subvermispora B]